MLDKIDYYVSKFFHEIYLIGGNFSTNIMKFISLLGEMGILFLLIGFGLALFKRTRKIGGTILLSIVIGFLITNVLLKNIIARARPFTDITSDYFKWWVDAGAVSESGYSFPSGHVTATTAFAMAILFTTRKKYSWPIIFLPILMASSRIYLMVHFFSDCLGGLTVGLVGATISYFVLKFIYSSKWKVCVWLREFNIFKPRQKSNIKTVESKSSTNKNNGEDIPEKEENPKTSSDQGQNNTDLVKTDIK